MVVFTHVTQEGAAQLIPLGFTQQEPKTKYEQLRLRKGQITAVLYTSGKLLVQGSEEDLEEIIEKLRKLHLGKEIKPVTFRKEEGWMIGSDESLKGDTFGGLVVAAVRANDETRKKLLAIGVADSKKLSDAEIISMAKRVKNIAECEIKSILPKEYNQKKKNVTELLNKLHHQCAQGLGPGKHVVDKYPGCKVGDIIVTKAESKYIEVAAASVIARAAALEQLSYLSKLAGFTLPKGSTHVQKTLEILRKENLSFKQFVKIDFRNVRVFLE